MKAVLMTEYGSPDVLKIKEVTTPAPKDNEILIFKDEHASNCGA